MKTFQLVLHGFDGGGLTDDKIIWVNAVGETALKKWIEKQGIEEFILAIETIDELLALDEGVDFVLEDYSDESMRKAAEVVLALFPEAKEITWCTKFLRYLKLGGKSPCRS